jgi:hypothetical protein
MGALASPKLLMLSGAGPDYEINLASPGLGARDRAHLEEPMTTMPGTADAGAQHWEAR